MTDIFEKAREQQRQLYEKLHAQPATEITGVVCPSGVGGSLDGGEELQTLLFTFEPWRDAEGRIHEGKLTVRNQVTGADLDKFRERVSAYQVIRLLVRIGEDDAFDCPQAVLVDLIDAKVVDGDLQQIADGLKKPLSISTKRFGKLTLDRSIGWYEGTTPDWMA